MFRSALFAVLAVALSSSRVFAQTPALEIPVVFMPEMAAAQPPAALKFPAEPVWFHVEVIAPKAGRPKELMPLYAMQGALQGMDLLTTFRAFDHGAKERNPIFKGQNRSTMVAAKMAASSLNLYLMEKLWQKNHTAAVAAVVVSNVMLSTLVANNVRESNRSSGASAAPTLLR